jgi:hypothetical protein
MSDDSQPDAEGSRVKGTLMRSGSATVRILDNETNFYRGFGLYFIGFIDVFTIAT